MPIETWISNLLEQQEELPRSEFVVCCHGFVDKMIVVMSKYVKSQLSFKIDDQLSTIKLLDKREQRDL